MNKYSGLHKLFSNHQFTLGLEIEPDSDLEIRSVILTVKYRHFRNAIDGILSVVNGDFGHSSQLSSALLSGAGAHAHEYKCLTAPIGTLFSGVLAVAWSSQSTQTPQHIIGMP